MLNKPKFMSPSVNMHGNTVIDLNSETLPFSCIVDGNEAITDFQIVVSKLSDNTVVFDTGMQTLEKPFFPINNRNQNVLFNIDLKKYFTADNSDKFINSASAYYWAITFKNSNSGTETYSAAEVFYANSIPDAVIYYSYNDEFSDLSTNYPKAEPIYDPEKIYFSIGSEGEFIKYDYTNEDDWNYYYKILYYVDYTHIQKRKVYFKSTYNQAEDVLLKRYGWRLTDLTSNIVVMDTITQNQIYGIADNISCVCNGLINGTKYLLELYIETQNGYFEVLKKQEFEVNYTVKTLDADFEIMALNNTSGIMLNWGNLRTTEGVVVGESVNYTENFPVESSASIEIPEETSVVFTGTSSGKDLSIDENSYVVLSFQFDKSKNMTLFEMHGEDEVSNVLTRKLESIVYGNFTMLQYTVSNGDIILSKSKQLSDVTGELTWCVVTLYPIIDNTIDFKVVESVAEDNLFPNEDLYPEDLYVYDNNHNIISDQYNRATQNYDPNLTYFKLVNDTLVEYEYDDKTWNNDWQTLYCCLHPYFGKWDKLRKEVV